MKREALRSRRASRLVAALLGAASLWLTLPGRLRAQEGSPDEYRVKLAFLYNFTKFVDWPERAFAGAQAPLVICVVGTDPFGRELEDDLSARTSGSHPVAVARRTFSGDFSSCHVVFVRAEERKHLATVISHLKDRDVLSVGEMPGFLESGGQVNFIFEEKSLRFEISLAATRQTQLKFSSKLLALARNLSQTNAGPETDVKRASGDKPGAGLR